MPHTPNTLSLVADVGGTNTRVALAEGAALLPDSIRKFSNAGAESLDGLLRRYVTEENVDCMSAAVALAGPVHNGKGILTNLDWSMDRDTLADITNAETVAVLNDLQAQAFALGKIATENLLSVLPGQPAPEEATRLVIGIGTGFNAALALRTPKTMIVPASECGHVSLPLRTAEDFRLAAYSSGADFLSVEDILSGRGVARIYAWLASEAGQSMTRTTDDIMRHSAANTDVLATRTVETFVRLMGRVAGDLALVHLPFGGLYLIGGVARGMAPYFERFGFSENFRDKGRFTDFMDGFSVDVIEDDFAALSGMALHLKEMRKS